ncbi:MAG: response regulator transcription factor [Drouetiella hepatica Uher 2000/2452]|jgi:DNA-binding NarL/FixJ family response regulator|uniref:Response regulator transcription factor n=1 Tax=Drouetiella hepatica Uher 2000/2452 TaxID=904376 RepID=A0A951QEC9_9CYAN|nr:response regulator transcription factor [Drouetiella hepatica Uher 2000/2452]
MNSSPVIRVLLADDHPVLGQGLAMLLECEPDITVVGQALNGREAIELFRQHQPDVTLMDLRMPEVSGVEAIAAIRAEFPQARIIVLTTYDGDEDIYRGLQTGAKGYLLKGTRLEELLNAIRTVYRNQSYIPPHIGAKLAERMGTSELSDRELEVLRLMAKGKNNPQISADLNIAESTVRFHISHILSKLGVSDRTQAVITAVQRGIVDLSV